MVCPFEEAQLAEGERRTIIGQWRRPGAGGEERRGGRGDVARKQTQVDPDLAPHPPGISYIYSRAGHPRTWGWGLSTHLRLRDQDRGHEKVRGEYRLAALYLPQHPDCPPLRLRSSSGNWKPGQQPSRHCRSFNIVGTPALISHQWRLQGRVWGSAAVCIPRSQWIRLCPPTAVSSACKDCRLRGPCG